MIETARAKTNTDAASKGGFGGLLAYWYFYCSQVVNWQLMDIFTADRIEEFITASIAAFTGVGVIAGWNRDQPTAREPQVEPKQQNNHDHDRFDDTFTESLDGPFAGPDDLLVEADRGYEFSKRSETILATVHPDLQKVTRLALRYSIYDFAVVSGARTLEEQRVLVDAGKSETMNSAHVQEPSKAVDIMAYGPDGGTWQVEPYYTHIRSAFERAAREYGIPMRGIITLKAGPDAGHHELSPIAYPDVQIA